MRSNSFAGRIGWPMPVRDGIPLMLPEEARTLNADDPLLDR